MMTEETITQILANPEKLAIFLESESNNGKRILVLERLGYLDKNFDKRPLIKLLSDPNDQIRYFAVKNLAKLRDFSLIDTFFYIATHDSASMVRREAVSGLGRLRDKSALPYLKKLASDKDPKVALQAIRGLLVFKNDSSVSNCLEVAKNHPNELVRDYIAKELGNRKDVVLPKHSYVNPKLKNVIINGDVLEILPSIPEESIHLTFTSPPYYNARDYSIYSSYSEYLSFLQRVFKEIHRITKEGRFFVLNTSPIIIPRVSRTHSSKRYPIPFDIHPLLIEMGWEFIDDIIWEKPEYTVKNRIAGFLQHRKPLAYKPNAVTEMIMVYRKKSVKLLDWNIHQYDTETVNNSKVHDGFETTNVWKIEPKYDRSHSAVFPIELCNKIIAYYSMVGDLVFDPFGGSGTMAKSAVGLGRSFLLTEIDNEYYENMKDSILQDNNYNQHKVGFLKSDEFLERMIK